METCGLQIAQIYPYISYRDILRLTGWHFLFFLSLNLPLSTRDCLILPVPDDALKCLLKHASRFYKVTRGTRRSEFLLFYLSEKNACSDVAMHELS